MPPENPPVARPKRPRRLDELSLAEAEKLGPNDSGEEDPAAHTEHDHDVCEAGSEDGDHGDGQPEKWERELDVRDPHDHLVEQATVVAGHGADRDPEDSGDDDADESNQQR